MQTLEEDHMQLSREADQMDWHFSCFFRTTSDGQYAGLAVAPPVSKAAYPHVESAQASLKMILESM